MGPSPARDCAAQIVPQYARIARKQTAKSVCHGLAIKLFWLESTCPLGSVVKVALRTLLIPSLLSPF